jgi:hypothetical protein
LADRWSVQSSSPFNEAAQARVGREAVSSRRAGLPIASCRTTLIDMRLVRAELARLRGPRPGTEIHRARVIGSSIAAPSRARPLA